MLNSTATKTMKGFWAVSGRVLLVKLKEGKTDYNLIQPYAPIAEASKDQITEFYWQLDPAKLGYLEMLEKMSQMKHETPADFMKIYAVFAPYYNKHIAAMRCSAPRHIANVFSDVVEPDDHCDKISMSIVDFTARTGLVCKQLREMGFKSSTDAHDGSDAMLAIDASLYRQTFCFLMEEVTKNSPEHSSGLCDVAIFCDSLCPDEVDTGCIKFAIDAIRHGGYVVFTIRLNPSNMEFVEKLRKKGSDLQNGGVWKLQSRLRVEDFVISPMEAEKSPNSDYNPGLVLCHQKTARGKIAVFKEIIVFRMIKLWEISKMIVNILNSLF